MQEQQKLQESGLLQEQQKLQESGLLQEQQKPVPISLPL
jgi:hypothetical protein